MGAKDKLVERFKKKPKDFTYEETLSLWHISAIMSILRARRQVRV